MSSEDHSTFLSPTVMQVVNQFIAAMTNDKAIDNDAIDRLEKLLRQGAVPKPNDINTALFEPPSEDGGDA